MVRAKHIQKEHFLADNTEQGVSGGEGSYIQPEGGTIHCWPIRESVDSLCRDDVDMPKPPYKRKACNLPNVAFVSLFRKLMVTSTQQHS